jgi:hypothetical protein
MTLFVPVAPALSLIVTTRPGIEFAKGKTREPLFDVVCTNKTLVDGEMPTAAIYIFSDK